METSKNQIDKILKQPLIYIKGVGEKRAALLAKELELHTVSDLLYYFPFRYEDRTRFRDIRSLTEEDASVQIKGVIEDISTSGVGPAKRMEAFLKDSTGKVKLVWFRNVKYVEQQLHEGYEYIVYGKPKLYGKLFSIPHPELELYSEESKTSESFLPVYRTTEKLKNQFLNSKGIQNILKTIFRMVYTGLEENLPQKILDEQGFLSRARALLYMHFPTNQQILQQARKRLIFEELFFIQVRLMQLRLVQKERNRGMVCTQIPTLHTFYKDHLPFELTNAQKKVLREIFDDLKSGTQMNRLLQGDVGSGKTIVAFCTMLMALDNQAQACLMAPTEVLAEQHYQSLKKLADLLDISIAMLTGSTKKKQRDVLHEGLRDGSISILIGTHALLEDEVQFSNLGLSIIDEQHRFGVAQRAQLAKKGKYHPPHMLIMSATPIPRTLAMTLYGDLDVSIIDELPKGRKPIRTVHKYESARLQVFGFIRKQIEEGRQAYIVYPLIEESEKMDMNNLMEGYESICRAFPEYKVSVVHGKMKAQDKDFEMKRFASAQTQIMVATTVIEVGVDVPNASIMLIENAERFGLSQLHQLRGRVGRGAFQSYCILLTAFQLSKDSRKRIETMVETTDGFEIAEVDLKLRGPGDLSGTRQSGTLELKLANMAEDQDSIQLARDVARSLIDDDPRLEKPDHQCIKLYLKKLAESDPINWSQIG